MSDECRPPTFRCVEGVLVSTHLARDLHDGPIQDVFATMMRLTALASRMPDGLKTDLDELIDLQSHIIGQMRSICRGESIFSDCTSAPSEVIERVVQRSSLTLGFVPTLNLDPFIDVVGHAVLADLACTVKECLSNIARHARATTVTVDITIDNNSMHLLLRVVDNGCGIAESATRGNGLANIRHRAVLNDGQCEFSAHPNGGTMVEWRVPLAMQAVAERQYGSTGGPDGSGFFSRVAAV